MKEVSGEVDPEAAGEGVSRRTVIQSAIAGAIAVSAGALRAAGPDPAYPVPDFDLEEATIAELQRRLHSGALSARTLAEKYLARIAMLDGRGPGLRSVLELNPDALGIADRLDAERKSKGARGPLHGIPILIKDNIDTADRMTTTAGSLALAGHVASRDSAVAQKLREAGAVILGKTNLSEWANFRSTHSSSGWSGRGGQARNPYALDRTPSGSSSGSAIAAAANLCAAAIGSETDGSIVSPASHCSVVGIKPTLGLVSRAGIIPIAHSQDTAGPMARTVEDAAILLGAIAGPDPRDPASAGSASRGLHDYTQFLRVDGLKGARIGIVRKEFGYTDNLLALLDEAVSAMKAAGAVLVDPVEMPTAGKFDQDEFEVLLYEFKEDLNRYLAGAGPDVPVHSLKEAIEFNERNAAKEMPWFGQEIFVMAEAKGPLTTKEYLDALAKIGEMSRGKGIDEAMDKHRLDALVTLTGGLPSLIDLVNGDHWTGGSSTFAAVAGYPAITVPAGYIHGLPLGLSFFGRAWSEPVLIRLAYAFEQATKARRPPRFLPGADLRA